jgi:hypothetical protein
VATTTKSNDTVTLARELPLQIRRRGVEQRLLISGGIMPRPRIDQALLKAVARGYCWLEDIVAGRAPSMEKIAVREGVSRRYVSRLIRLGLLGPEVVEIIAAGQQAPELTTQSLVTGEREVSLNWRLQRQTFALSPQP